MVCIIVGMEFYCNLSVGYGWIPGWFELSMLEVVSSSRDNFSFGVDMDLVLDYRHFFSASPSGFGTLAFLLLFIWCLPGEMARVMGPTSDFERAVCE
jgi:hypothetical protein